jgi:hypothetical protein
VIEDAVSITAGMVCYGFDWTDPEVARPAGFEPTTFGFGDRHSIQLSYGRVQVPES